MASDDRNIADHAGRGCICLPLPAPTNPECASCLRAQVAGALQTIAASEASMEQLTDEVAALQEELRSTRAELAEVKAERDAMRQVVDAAVRWHEAACAGTWEANDDTLLLAIHEFRAAQQERADVNTFDRTPDERAAKLKRWGTQETTNDA